MNTPEWDGVTQPDMLSDEANALRQQLADAAKAYDWKATLTLLAIVSQIKNLEGREIYRFQMRSPSGLSRFFI